LSALVGDEFFARLSDTELKGFLTETQVLGWNVTVKEDVDTFTNGVRLSDNTINSWLAVEKTDKVTLEVKSASIIKIGKVSTYQIVQYGQIVLDNDDVVGWLEE